MPVSVDYGIQEKPGGLIIRSHRLGTILSLHVIWNRLKKATHLEIHGFYILQIERLRELKNLQDLVIVQCSLEPFNTPLQNITSLTLIQTILKNIDLVPNLTQLVVQNNSKETYLIELTHLPRLKSLKLEGNCQISNCFHLPFLKTVVLNLERLEYCWCLAKSLKLESLAISSKDVDSIYALLRQGFPSLTDLVIHSPNPINALFIGHTPMLQRTRLVCSIQNFYLFLYENQQLEHVEILHVANDDLTKLLECPDYDPHLRSLEICLCPGKTSMSYLKLFSCLEKFIVNGVGHEYSFIDEIVIPNSLLYMIVSDVSMKSIKLTFESCLKALQLLKSLVVEYGYFERHLIEFEST